MMMVRSVYNDSNEGRPIKLMLRCHDVVCLKVENSKKGKRGMSMYNECRVQISSSLHFSMQKGVGTI